MTDRHKLRWSYPLSSSTTTLPLPSHITRHFIPTAHGTLELLVASPSSSKSSTRQPRKPALLFQHGGFGCASVWVPFLTYFSQLHSYPCYALSLRGHGESWKPSYMRMVWGTGLGSLTADLSAGMQWVRAWEGARRDEDERLENGLISEEDVVLIGHSAGGGLSQVWLDRGLGKIKGLVLMAAFPNFGGWGVYWNWFKLDPWFTVRYYIRDLWHSRSPLSSTSLVHQAFFSQNCPRQTVEDFEAALPEFESMLWPLSMMLSFVKVKNVVKNILGWQSGKGDRLLIVAGEKDKLMSVDLMEKMAAEYRSSGSDDLRRDVAFEVVSDVGHHIQNDTNWEEGARKILAFLEQL